MAKNIDDLSVFGDYKVAENRVTAALLQIFKTGKEPLLRHVLNDIGLQLPDSDIRIVSQPDNPTGGSRPDGLLRSIFAFNLYIESKLHIDSVREGDKQLREHKKAITGHNNFLLYVTPDIEKPRALEEVDWLNWESLLNCLEEYTLDTTIGDYELLSYLVVEFRKLADNNDLIQEQWAQIRKSDQVIILAGSWAEAIALKHGYYICQNRRTFRPSGYIAFYKSGRISYLFKILHEPEDDVDLTKDERFEEYIRQAEPNYEPGHLSRVIALQLDQKIDIINDKRDKNGNICPYTYGQARYTSHSNIIKAQYTSEL